MNWYIKTLKDFSNFEGRSQRKEYWVFWLFNFIIGFVLSFVELTAGSDPGDKFGLLTGFFFLIIIVPSIAVAVRRLHDTGRSGWWLLLSFIPRSKER